jgi:hypothetical protein
VLHYHLSGVLMPISHVYVPRGAHPHLPFMFLFQGIQLSVALQHFLCMFLFQGLNLFLMMLT